LADDTQDDSILSIDAYVERIAVAAVEEDTASRAVAQLSPSADTKTQAQPSETLETQPAFESMAMMAMMATMPIAPDETPAAVPPAVSPAVSPAVEAMAADEIERERQALVDAIVGAAVQAAADKRAQRDREIDHDAVRLFAADPFEEPFIQSVAEEQDPAIPSPFDDDSDITTDMRSSGVKDFSETHYTANHPTPVEHSSAPGVPPRSATPRSIPATTAPIGMPIVRPPESDGVPFAPPVRPRSPTPRRRTPVMSMHMVTPYSTPVIPYSAPTPIRSATPIAVSIPTPRSVPAVPDVDGARTVAGALEMVAAQIRAGHLVIAGDVPPGTGQSTQAACLAVALTALLGVRH
jgi:hypothetical protein